MPKILLPHLYLATGRRGDNGDSSGTLGMVNAWDQAMWCLFFVFVFFILPSWKTEDVSLHYLSQYLFTLVFVSLNLRERGVFSGHKL